jgi:hypothetical protein
MKKFIISIAAIIVAANSWAQAPQSMSYQAIIRNASNVLITSTTVGMKVSVLQGSNVGTAVYVETQTPATDINGLVTIQVGGGTVVSGTFSGINWANGPYFLKTETDPTGGNSYTITGTSELMSVPYALFANSVLNTTPDIAGSGINIAGDTIINNTQTDATLSGNGTSSTPLGIAQQGATTGQVLKWNGSWWVPTNDSIGGNGWLTTGNSGIVDSVNFIGTTDSVPFNIRVNNQKSGRIDINSGNTFFGYQANVANTTGIQNTVVGMQSLEFNTTGVNNTANGYHSLVQNTTGGNNVGYGFCTLVNNTVASSNTAIGNWALFKDSASYNTAVGDSALYANTSGTGNAALGYQALAANTSGIQNTVLGMQSLEFNTTGANNTAAGYHSLVQNTTGGNNVGYGFCTLVNNVAASSNTAIGNWSLFKDSANANTGVGDSSLYSNTTGTRNAAVGYQALYINTTGSNNTAIGDSAGPSSNSLNNTTAIGYGATTTADNSVVVGNSNVTSIGGEVSWSTLSDGRYKTNVQDYQLGLDFILNLRPVSYNYTNNSNGVVYNGFIAQEVEKNLDKSGAHFSGLVKPQTANDHYSLRYSDFVVPLVNAVKELNTQNESLKKQLDEQKSLIANLELEMDNIKAKIK